MPGSIRAQINPRINFFVVNNDLCLLPPVKVRMSFEPIQTMKNFALLIPVFFISSVIPTWFLFLISSTVFTTSSLISGSTHFLFSCRHKVFFMSKVSAPRSEINDSLSFSSFIGLPSEESAPDHSTICRFRSLLVGKNALDKLLKEINR
jgi:hypothetical protein